ncbi:MAG: biotin carboxylase [Arenicellales bacterium]
MAEAPILTFIASLFSRLKLWFQTVLPPDPPHQSISPETAQEPASHEPENSETRINTMKKLSGLSDIRRYFHRNETPIYFVSATNFNLLGINEWVRNFRYINYIDCFDGRHPNVRIPEEQPHREFTGIEDINNYLLQHKEVVDYINHRGPGGKAVFLMFNEETESICKETGLDIWFPSAKLRSKMDNKIETVRIGNRAGVPSVPNALATIKSYDDLQKASEGLGDDLVLQTAFGDSGKTTFFIASEEDWDRHKEEIIAEPEMKIMKRINCRGSAIEACATKCGTIVGPLMTELVGFKELTPYKGGWCGNEIFADSFNQEIRDKARNYTRNFGEALREEGYRGYFELDFLIDLASNELYLGELNPRVTGASSMTNHAAFAHADAPLFLFHLLEFSDVPFEIDIDELNQRWADPDNIDSWSQLVIKHVDQSIDYITKAPESGIWKLQDDNSISFTRFDYHRRAVEDESHGFYLRISGQGDYRYKGADLGILITRGRLMTDDFELNDRAKAWINGIVGEYQGMSLEEVDNAPAPPVGLKKDAFKIL